MKKLLLTFLAAALLVASAGCGPLSNREVEESDAEAADTQASPSAPEIRVESSKPEEESGSGSSAPAPSESQVETPDNANPDTQPVPAIDPSVFYDANEAGANLSVLCPGVGRYWLSYENSKSLIAYLDFDKLTPTDQTETLEIDSADPGIVYTASDFSYELRLDQKANLAVYEIGGSTRYYYAMPAGFYDTAYEWAAAYAQYNYNEGDEDALNVATGLNPYSDGN